MSFRLIFSTSPAREGTARRSWSAQLSGMGQLFSVGHHAAQRLPRPVGADIQVADQPRTALLVIGGNLKLLHPVLEGPAQGGHRLRLEAAVRYVQHMVAASPVIADGQPIPLLPDRNCTLLR